MLAIHGGKTVRDKNKNWPKWPQYSNNTEKLLKSVLESGRCAISGPWTGSKPKEQEFAEHFAAFNKVSYCVPTDHGSSSLVIALEALDVGANDEVIVPVLTWVATATAVINVNAIPVFVDIDPDTGCISPDAIENTITSRTKAIIPVHLHCMMADMDRIMSIASENNLFVLEDCAQAHGACWNGRYAGSIGHLGAFSMQQSKVLTAGEGGAVITNSYELYDRLQQLRADSRRYSSTTPQIGKMHLVEACDIMGTNYCLSEFQAAILLDQLPLLEKQNRHRESNALYLNEQLKALGGLYPLERPSQLEKQSIYEYGIHYSPEAFANKPINDICRALEAELYFSFYPTDLPLHQNPMYSPWTKRRFHWSDDYMAALDKRDSNFPSAEKLQQELILFHHSVLLGDSEDMDDIVNAFEKVKRYAAEV